MSIHLTNNEIRSIDTPEVQQKIISAVSEYLKETVDISLAGYDLTITATPRGIPGKKLIKFAGSIDREDLDQIRENIETYCSKVEPNEW